LRGAICLVIARLTGYDLAGGYTGARIQSRMPDVLIRRLVGVLVMAIGAYFLWSGLS
jgi:uncharacterized membrane protein YfcA